MKKKIAWSDEWDSYIICNYMDVSLEEMARFLNSLTDETAVRPRDVYQRLWSLGCMGAWMDKG